MPRLVTLSTDLGDAYAAQMKAVLYRRLPPGAVVDLTHQLPPHRSEEAAFLLLHMARGFPPGTVHLAVVDPGVGGSRAPLVLASCDGSFLVGPDNGLLVPLAEALGSPRAFRLDPQRVAPGVAVSSTFEGRDLFAPAAALLAEGVPVARLGSRTKFRKFVLPVPRRAARAARGVVVHIDAFGNVISNVPTEWLPAGGRRVRLRTRYGRRTLTRRRTYSEAAPGTLILIGSSFGLAELAIREGRAANRLRLEVGDGVNFDWAGSRRSAQDSK